MSWVDGAACRGQQPLFFSLNPERRRQALAICEACPVLGPCRDAAKASHATGVVQGGMDLTDARNANDAARKRGETVRTSPCSRCGVEFSQPFAKNGGRGHVRCPACRVCAYCRKPCADAYCSDEHRRFAQAANKNRSARARRASA